MTAPRTLAGDVLAFTACSRELAAGRLAPAEHRTVGTVRARLDGVCPVHHTDACLQRYVSARWLAGWSVLTFLTWRKFRRPGGGR